MRVAFVLLLVGVVVVSARRRVTRQDYDEYNQACSCPGTLRCFCVDNVLCFSNKTINFQGNLIVSPRIDSDPVIDCGVKQTCCQDTNDEPLELPPTPSSDDRCGVRGGTTAPTRVLGEETDTEFGEFPWMLAIFRPDKGGRKMEMQCGASLIAPNVALTAAHCVNEFKEDASVLTVRAGEWNMEETTEPEPYQERSVVGVVVHDQYVKETLKNDIALLVLESDMDEASHVRPICLPPQGANFQNKNCLATGWGRDIFGNLGTYQPILRKADLPIVERGECQKRLRKTRLSRFFRLHSSFLCAGGESATDTCEGDGGGPLVCETSTGVYAQAGIVSWGVGCGTNALPGVYVDVAQFIDWLQIQFELLGIK